MGGQRQRDREAALDEGARDFLLSTRGVTGSSASSCAGGGGGGGGDPKRRPVAEDKDDGLGEEQHADEEYDHDDDEADEEEETVVLKTIVVRAPTARDPDAEKTERTWASYVNERNVYRLFRETASTATAAVTVPDLLYDRIAGDDRRMALLLSDLAPRFPVHPGDLDATELTAVLRAIAATATATLPRPAAAAAASAAVSTVASYWALPRRRAEWARMAATGHRRRGAAAAASVEERLKAAAETLDAVLAPRAVAGGGGGGSGGGGAAYPRSRARCCTLVHGDLKAENVLFGNSDNGDDGVAFCDFQWSGWGNPMRDLAYLVVSSAASDALVPPQRRPRQQQRATLSASGDGGDSEDVDWWVAAYRSFLPPTAFLAAAAAATAAAPPAAAAPADAGHPDALSRLLQLHFDVAVADYMRFLAGWDGGMWGNCDWAMRRTDATLRTLDGGLLLAPEEYMRRARALWWPRFFVDSATA
ncbi:kinase-like domain-containing protein [Zopfochytrium polystomum]|nr:kinase-like domain-containing protein [Zopfochytrium polystomum]